MAKIFYSLWYNIFAVVGIILEEDNIYAKSNVQKCENIEKTLEYSNKLVLKVTIKEIDVPLMYRFSKLHRNPLSTRFAIISKPCSTFQINKI